jgi:hypothetical protein
VLYRDRVRIIRDAAPRVEANVTIPVSFPITGWRTAHDFTITASMPEGGR